MLPGLGPRVTITPNTGGGLRHSCGSSRPPASSEASRTRRSRPPLAPGCSAATLAQPTRKSLDGIKPFDSAGLRPEQLLDDVQTLPVVSAPSDLPHSVSAASLSSESDLALLLGSDRDQAGGSSTPLVFGTFPPVTVSLPAAASADAQPEATSEITAADDSTSADSKTASKLKATSHEFYPQAYLAAAAAATALAARTISSSISRSTSPAAEAPAAPAAEQAEDAAAEIVPAVAELAVTVAEDEQQDVYPAEQMQHVEAEQQPQDTQSDPSQQQYWLVQHQGPTEQQWQQPMSEQQWHEHQQWHHWQQQQQAQPQMVPMPVFVPVYVQPYPYPHYVQQHPQMHMMPVMLPPEATAIASQHQQQLPQPQPMSVCPPSPGAYSLPADTCSLMSAATPAATPTAWQHSVPYGSSRPGSSASSVVSAYSSCRRQRQQQQFGEQAREAGTVTVSAMSCVKDAAGALAKVVTRHGNCLLLSLVKPGDAVAQATHVAAKSLAVARFYVNAHMAAAGAAGIDAAAALTGVEHTADAAAAAKAVSAEAAAAAAGAAVDDEVVFMPYQRSSSSRPSDAADVPLGFVVAKASTRDLPVQLPPPVGIPACMQDNVQQAGQQQQAAASASASGSSSGATLLKAGANTDVNKLSNAVIHNILGSGHVAMQLAGAAACHVAMRALIKAHDRLLRKFNTDIVATASFANEDTSSSIGRSTVFLRLDVMRSNVLRKVAAAGSAVVQAIDGQQQPQLAAAMS